MRYFCTYFDRNYLERGLALYASLKMHCREFHLDILCLDDECRKTLAQLSMPECTIIPLRDLEVADPGLLAVKGGRTTVEYYFTLTPCQVRHLLGGIPESEVLTYLDADLYFFANPEPVFEELQNASIGIISHRFPEWLGHMNMHGIYNVGWISFRNDSRGRACNDWWRERCLEWCYNRLEGDRYADQGYLNDWPVRFEGSVVIQHLGANVAPWNVGQYEIAGEGSNVTINGQRLIFYHFHALRRVTGHLFDSRLCMYGTHVTRELRELIYEPYLNELRVEEQKLRALSMAASPAASPEPEFTQPRFALIPRVDEPGAGTSTDQAKVEDYLYRNLVLSDGDRCVKAGEAVAIHNKYRELENKCSEFENKYQKSEASLAYLTNRSLLFYNLFWVRSTVRNLKLKFENEMVKRCRTKLGILRQYEPRGMPGEKFPRPSLADSALPSIGIVTPSFMQGHFLDRTMQSVLSQEYPKLSYIVQDGGSKDGSVDIIKRHASKLAAWESAPDRGQSDAVKRGFQKCKTDVMAWLNSDDMLMPGALRFIGEYFAAHPKVDAIYGHRVVIDENDREVGRWVLPRHHPQILKWLDYVPQETLFWRRELWEKVGGVDTSFRFALDWDLLVRFEKAGAKIMRIPYFLGCFRIHDMQKTSAKMDTHGVEEMERILKAIHGRKIGEPELYPYRKLYVAKSAKTAWLLSMGIRT